MTKLEFLNTLESCLSPLTKEEREKRLSYYAELLDDMMEDGMDEQAACAKLGAPTDIAATILQEMRLPQLVRARIRPKKGWSALSIILVILGAPIWLPITLAIAAVFFSIYFVLWSIILVLFSVVLALAFSSISLFVLAAANLGPAFILALLLFGTSLFCAGFSVFAFYGALAAAKGLIWLTVRFARGIKSLFIKKEAQV